MKTVDIPGGTATLREKDDIKVRQRQLVESRAVAAASALEKLPEDRDELEGFDITQSGLTGAEADALFDLQSATIVAAIASWSLPGPIPTMDTIGDLDGDLYDELGVVTSSVGKEIVAPDDFDPTDPRSPEFKSSPTTPSGASADASRADQELQPTVSLPTATESTASAESSQA